MMQSPLGSASSRPEVACVATEGCSYLRALATIEHIAGFEHTAHAYAMAAERCREHGCWAASEAAAPASAEASRPITLKSFYQPSRRRAGATGRAAEPVPFVRSELIDIVSDAEGNTVERRPLKLDSLPRRGDPLGSLYRYWCDLRAANACRFSDIDTVQLARAEIIGKLHVVDVSSCNPHEFRFDLFAYAVPIGRYDAPCAHPVRIWADSLMRDYNTVRLTAAPRLHRVRCELGGVGHHYTRLILPFQDKRARVSRLLVAIREEPGNGVRVKAGG